MGISKPFFKLFGAILLLIATFNSYAQPHDYLVDNVNLENLSEEEAYILDSCLTVFHNSNSEQEKIQSIQHFIEMCNTIKVWPAYNQWVFEYIEQIEENANPKLNAFLKAAKADVLNNFGYFHQFNGDYQKAIEFYKSGLEQYKLLDDSTAIANSLNNIGSVYYYKGNIAECLSYYQESLDIRNRLGDQYGIANSLNNIGIILQDQGDNITALDYFLRSLDIRKQLGDQDLLANSYNNIGLSYLETEQYDDALKYFVLALEIDRQAENDYAIATSLFNIAKVYKNRGEYDKAYNALTKSKSIYSENDYKRNQIKVTNALGELKYIEHDYQESINLYNQAGELAQLIDDKDDLCDSYIGLARNHLHNGDISSALDFANSGLKIAEELGYPQRIKDASLTLSSIYETVGSYDKSLEYFKRFKTMSDSLVNVDTQKTLAIQDIKYQHQEQLKLREQQHQAELNFLQQRSNTQVWIIGIITLSLFSLGILMLLLQRNIKLIRKQKDQLQKKSEENLLLVREVHHRSKNNLQVILGIIGMQESLLKDPNFKSMLKEVQNRIKSMALLHDMLFRKEENLMKINFQEYLEKLSSNLLTTVKDNRLAINLEIETNDIYLNSDTCLSIGLVVNEIITNALKYGFPVKTNGTIYMRLRKEEKNGYLLEIGDDGIGINKPYGEYSSDSLGLKLIYTTPQYLNGRTETDKNKKGTHYKIYFEEVS